MAGSIFKPSRPLFCRLLRLGEFLMGMQGAQQQPAVLVCLFFALHDATLGAWSDISRPGKCHSFSFVFDISAGLQNEGTFPAGQALQSGHREDLHKCLPPCKALA